MDKRKQIQKILLELYGDELGAANYRYLNSALDEFLRSRNAAGGAAAGEGPSKAEDHYAGLAGKVFAICYPDNVYNDTDPTLTTLGQTLAEYFPSVNGLHILPERVMSHDDIWPQDFFAWLVPRLAVSLVEHLIQAGVLTSDRTLSGTVTDEEIEAVLQRRYEAQSGELGIQKEEFLKAVTGIIDSRKKSHFNDGGFSQITRERVDPRFGSVDDLRRLSGKFSLMLDFVVNHLDVDNEILDAYRRGENDGSAFIIISPDEYQRLKSSGEIAKAFRPRPFPLFTGLRKYPKGGDGSALHALEKMDSAFQKEGLSLPDRRVTQLLSIYFKLQNDQGLSSEDRTVVDGFFEYLTEKGIEPGTLFGESQIQEEQPALKPAAAAGMAECCKLAGLDTGIARVFELYDDEIFGSKFFIYTTFSESQADLNPVSPAGFRLIFDDLIHLLSSGDLTMMRMDAVKYLWKEIGKKNFDMEEGDKLIEVIRLFLGLAAPETIPLDEVNSSDQDVYRMGSEGGFYYLFGQVNALPAAFNSESLRPLERLTSTMKSQCPENLLLFVTLSTHDGRSIQGIGVDRSDGHVSMVEFSSLKKASEAAGGKVKYRSVPTGRVPADTFKKVCGEIGCNPAALKEVFRLEGDEFVMTDASLDRNGMQSALSTLAGKPADDPDFKAATGYLSDWVVGGRAPYEMCCTSRAAFAQKDSNGKPVSPEEEARRLALAQVFVLSFGQTVPAVYFNDLLGLGNDITGYTRSGRPRDLNRHKNSIDEIRRALSEDAFTREYVPLLNTAIKARTEDPAFRPGSHGYEYLSLSDTVFLNHLYADAHHSLVIGNIAPRKARIKIALTEIEAMEGGAAFTDRLSGKSYTPGGDVLDLQLPGYGGLWLSS